MGPKKGRKNVSKIEVRRDKSTESELGDKAADRREKREQRERGGRQKYNIGRRGGKPVWWKLHSHTEGVVQKRPRTERSDSEINEHFNDKTRKGFPRERIASSRNVCESMQIWV